MQSWTWMNSWLPRWTFLFISLVFCVSLRVEFLSRVFLVTWGSLFQWRMSEKSRNRDSLFYLCQTYLRIALKSLVFSDLRKFVEVANEWKSKNKDQNATPFILVLLSNSFLSTLFSSRTETCVPSDLRNHITVANEWKNRNRDEYETSCPVFFFCCLTTSCQAF